MLPTTQALHLERTGSGPPVVMSHGLGDDARTWAAVAPLLAASHTVVTWDLRGHGRSDAPADASAYSREAGIADLLAVMAEIGEPAHLVGHSLGGYLSLAVSLRHPDLVRSLTLIGSGPGYRDATAREGWNRLVAKAVVNMPVPAVAAGLAKQEDSSVMDQVAELRPPLLIVVGERDTRFHASSAFLARSVPGATQIVVAGAGHHPQVSDPDLVAAAVVAHVAKEQER